ncbi:hypothetical protein EDD11_005541 [Mortierella claussenii]|nr:hypothetical protein EDD11_005541 [Mortierella claussenii]
MDSRTLTKFPHYLLYCGVMTCLTSLSIGYVIGSPNIPESSIRGSDGACGPNPYTVSASFPNCFQFSDLIWGFAVGSFCLGACAGGLIGGSIQNQLGRIKTMMLSNFIFMAGALILGLTYHQSQFVVGRMVIGFACGVGGVVVPTYLGEITTVHGRGIMGTFHQLFIVIGLVISNLVGLAWSSPPGWRVVLAANAIPALIQCLILSTLVESPRYLVSQQRLAEARVSLQRLRGPATEVDVSKEFKEMVIFLLGEDDKEADTMMTADESLSMQAANFVQREKSSTVLKSDCTEIIPSDKQSSSQGSYGILKLFRSECRGLASIGVLVHFLQQASGINGLVYYSTSFLANAFGPSNSQFITLGVSCCSLACTILSVYLIDRFNRKTLLMASFIGMSFSSALLVVGAYCDVGALVVVAVFLYIASFAIALGPIPWLLLSEMLPTYALSSASGVATGVNWGTNFVVGLVFPSMTKTLGSGTFILFGAINAFGIFYVWFFVPETQGRSIESVLTERGVSTRPCQPEC